MTSQQQYTESLIAMSRAQLASKLEEDGYEVVSEAVLESQKADLLATKPGEKTLLYEFQLSGDLQNDSNRSRTLQQLAKARGYDFRLRVVVPPTRVNIEVDGLKEALFQWIDIHKYETALGSVARNIFIEEANDINVQSLTVHGDTSDIKGGGVISTQFVYLDGGVSSYDTLHFNFDLTLNSKREIVEVRKLEIDISSL